MPSAKITFISVAQCKGFATDKGISINPLKVPHLPADYAGLSDEFLPRTLYSALKILNYSVLSEPPEKVPLYYF